MTLEELLAREGIRKTMARYTMAGDRLRVDEFAAVFTQDGVIETEGVSEKDRFRYEGRAAIRAWLARFLDTRSDSAWTGPKFLRHHLSTCMIELTGPDAAKTRTYWVAYSDLGPDHAGYYVDDFRKVNDEWLIAHRRIREDWRLAQSRTGETVTVTRQR